MSENPGVVPPPESSFWPYIGVGCLTTVVGFFGGGMIAALAAKVTGALGGCVPPEGFPACNTWSFVIPGAIIGAVALPVLAILRLRRGRRSDAQQNSLRKE